MDSMEKTPMSRGRKILLIGVPIFLVFAFAIYFLLQRFVFNTDEPITADDSTEVVEQKNSNAPMYSWNQLDSADQAGYDHGLEDAREESQGTIDSLKGVIVLKDSLLAVTATPSTPAVTPTTPNTPPANATPNPKPQTVAGKTTPPDTTKPATRNYILR